MNDDDEKPSRYWSFQFGELGWLLIAIICGLLAVNCLYITFGNYEDLPSIAKGYRSILGIALAVSVGFVLFPVGRAIPGEMLIVSAIAFVGVAYNTMVLMW